MGPDPGGATAHAALEWFISTFDAALCIE